MKRCSNCDEPNELEDFPKDKKKKDGCRGVCKKCKRDQDIARENASKIYCARGEGGFIDKENCLPGCNSVCSTCDNRQEGNLKAINSTTADEDKEQFKNTGRGGSFAGQTFGAYFKTVHFQKDSCQSL